MLLGACSLGVYAFYDAASVFVNELEMHPAITDELSRVIVENEELRDIFGQPINVRFVGASTEYYRDGDNVISNYRAPIYGPLNEGTITAEIKLIGDIATVTKMIIEIDSGESIQITPK